MAIGLPSSTDTGLCAASPSTRNDMAMRWSMCVAQVIADHRVASGKGLTQGVAASRAHTVKGGDGCC